jgi:hypothetical protein
MKRKSAEIDLPFPLACMAMFDGGLDTADIADRLLEPEADVYRVLRIGRETRRQEAAAQ